MIRYLSDPISERCFEFYTAGVLKKSGSDEQR
jgi:hypothetical protein